MKPLRNLLIVELDAKGEEKTQSGIIIPKEKWEKPQNIATVIDVGPEVKLVKKGDRIIINPYAVIDTAEKQIKILRESDVLCKT